MYSQYVAITDITLISTKFPICRTLEYVTEKSTNHLHVPKMSPT